jgi:O-antigen/teichoic acid export membrane protein
MQLLMSRLTDRIRSYRQNVLVTGAAWMVAGQGMVFFLQAVYFILLSRLLGSTEYGLFVGASALVAIVSNFSSIGSGIVLIRYVNYDATAFPRYWGNALATTALTGMLLAAVITLVGPALLHTNAVGMLAMIAIGDCLCSKLAEVASKSFQAFERLRETAFLTALVSVVRVAAVIILTMFTSHATAAMWAAASLCVSTVAALAAVIAGIVLLGRPSLELRLMWQTAAEGLGYSFASSTTSVYNDVDKAMLTHYGMNAANGVYSLAYRVIDIACIPIRSIHAAAFSRFFRIGKDGVSGTAKFARSILGKTFCYAVLAAVGIFLLSPVAPHVVGKSFARSVSALRWLCLIPLLRSFHLSAGDAITGAGFQRLRTGLQFSAAALNFGANLYLIPRFSWRGAAGASLLTDGSLAIVSWVILAALIRVANRAEQKEVAVYSVAG